MATPWQLSTRRLTAFVHKHQKPLKGKFCHIYLLKAPYCYFLHKLQASRQTSYTVLNSKTKHYTKPIWHFHQPRTLQLSTSKIRSKHNIKPNLFIEETRNSNLCGWYYGNSSSYQVSHHHHKEKYHEHKLCFNFLCTMQMITVKVKESNLSILSLKIATLVKHHHHIVTHTHQ